MPMNEADKNLQGEDSIVFKLDFHCEGCVQKIKKIVCRVKGVKSVKVDLSSNKLMVTGEVDAVKLRDMQAKKIRRKVEIPKLYEVFLSFRGEDTRTTFASRVYTALQNEGINVYWDEDSLERGDQISSSLLEAIELSHTALIVFSTNYANSRWCLDELVKIMKCRRTRGLKALPVFYDVDPSEVRHQKGEFGKAFQSRLLNNISNKEGLYDVFGKALRNLLNKMSVCKDESPNQVLSWRAALRQAANLAGFVISNFRNESEAIKKIVEKVTGTK